MNPQESTETHHSVDRTPARALLEGLARVYNLVVVTDVDGVVLWVSNGLSELCGDQAFRVGQNLRSVLPQLPKLQNPEQMFSARSQLRNQGYLSKVHLEFATKSEPISVEVDLVPVMTGPSERAFYVLIARPLDFGHAASRKAMPPVDEALTALIDDTRDGIVTVDERGYVVYANSAAVQLVGHELSEIVDRPIAALLSDAGDLERLMGALCTDGRVNNWELTLARSDGRGLRVAASARVRRRDDGLFGGAWLCLRDPVERDTLVKELQLKNNELEHCVHTLAHDLRSPLVSLLGFSRLLREDYNSKIDETGMHFIERIEQAGRTMEDLIHDLLELSRIGQPGDRRSLVDPNAVLQQLKAEMKPRMDSAGIQLDIPENAPLVFCDRTRLYEVFSNLIGNAIDHMGPCDNRFVEVSITDDGDCNHISVRDGGRGVAPEHHEQIFDVFQSLGPASDGRRGTGIGLAIVKKIAETHGGRAWLESSPEAGAEFHVTFPHA